jgi:hypothetical protein
MPAVEHNILTYYRGIARYLGGRFIENEQVAWFTTGRRSLLRFNAVLRTVAGSLAELRRVADPILFATPSGFPLYQRLGFETVATVELFGWEGVQRL